MLPGLFFTCWRFAQIITLIIVVGMLSWFVHGFVKNNSLTPNFILVLFIVSVLALVWSLATLLAYGFTKHNGRFVAFIELCFVGSFIAGVYELRGISGADCSNFATTAESIYVGLGPFGFLTGSVRYPYVSFDKNCSMLKACFAFGIMNCFFFFFTFFIALWIHHHHRNETRRGSRSFVEERRTVRRSGSRGYSSSPRRSHHSRRSSYGRSQV